MYVECVHKDNGLEFTNSVLPSPKIQHTPRHNGKVERSHRKENEYFYATHKFYSFVDFKKQLAVHSRKYNKFPMRPLNWKSHADYIKAFINFSKVF